MSETAPKCTSRWGHKFVARYSTESARFESDELNALALVNRNEDRIYERDICVRCGHVIERQIINEKAEVQA